MPPPSQLSIATSALTRLVKEERSYHKELEQQNARVQKLEGQKQHEGEGEEGNAEFTLRQERKAIEETKAVFPSLRARIGDAVRSLEEQLELAKQDGNDAPVEQITKAEEAIAEGKTSQKEIA